MNVFSNVPQIYLYPLPVDFRKSINGLAVIVEQQMKLSPFADAIFIFCNKSKDKLKILYWDKTGFALWYKRLDKDKFKWPTKVLVHTMDLSNQQFEWLLGGYDIVGHQALHYQSVAL